MFTIKKKQDSTGTPNIYLKSGMGYYNMIGNVTTDFSEIYYTGTWKKANPLSYHLGFVSCLGTFIIKNWMIKKGEYKPYEPYGVSPSPEFPNEIESVTSHVIITSFDGSEKESIVSIPLLHDLRSLPNGVCDRIYYEDGKWYDEQKVGQVILDGSEAYGYGTGQSAFYTTLLANIVKKPANNSIICVMSNYFKGETANHCVNSEYNYCLGFNTLGSLWIRYNELSTVEQLKSWLSEHNTEVLYELAELIVTEITDEDAISALESIKTYKGITNITSAAPCILTYYRDTPISNEYETKNDANKKQEQTIEKFSQLEATDDQIKIEVGKRVGKNEVISSINMSAESSVIKSDKISLERKNN